jgi:hypothetical protein
VCIYRGECLYLYFALASSLLTVRRSLTDFVNLKIKLVQPFESDSRGRVCVNIFIEMSTHIYISICVCMTYKKKIFRQFHVQIRESSPAQCNTPSLHRQQTLNWCNLLDLELVWVIA